MKKVVALRWCIVIGNIDMGTKKPKSVPKDVSYHKRISDSRVRRYYRRIGVVNFIFILFVIGFVIVLYVWVM